MDRAGLADFLRRRRESLQPEDVGLPRGSRRRTRGLRREEVADLCHMSSDYYARLERERGPQPSQQMLASMAQGLGLSRDEHDHLFRLAGHQPPARELGGDLISPALLRVLGTLDASPAEIVTELGETLRQTALSVALMGDLGRYTGPERSRGYRWFTDPASREIFAAEDHPFLSRMFVSGLRGVATLRGPGSRAAVYTDLLLERSEEFRTLWAGHEVGLRPDEVKRFVHPRVGALTLNCQTLHDPGYANMLMVYTAEPGTESHQKLQLLSVVGAQF